jgi:hypothetical protein
MRSKKFIKKIQKFNLILQAIAFTLKIFFFIRLVTPLKTNMIFANDFFKKKIFFFKKIVR